MAKRTLASELKESLTVDKATLDGFSNFVAKLGLNTNNLQSNSTYSLSPFLSRLRVLLEAAYRSSWIVGQVVDTVAEDMTRDGISVNSKLSPDDINIIQAKITELSIFHELCNAIKWARLYGGALAVILTEGADYSKPLNYDSIGKGRFKGLLVLDRWMVDPSFGDLVTEVGRNMGKPKYYRVISGMPSMSGINIHYSRVIRFDGIELPYYQKLTENLWGLSVIERMYDRLIAYDSATLGASQLMYKAHLRVMGIKDLRKALAMGGKTESAVIKQFNYIRLLQANEGITVLDSEDTFNLHTYSFGGISDLLIQFGEQISGATGIPLVRLFGQSPAGLSSTGESDLRNYYDHINKLQENQMRAGIHKILEVMSRSELGKKLPDGFTFDFNSLWQMSDTEKSTIASNDANTVSTLYTSGVYTKKIALREIQQQAQITGRGTNISDEDIENAVEPSPGEFPPGAPPESGTGGAPPSIEELKEKLAKLDEGTDDFAKMKEQLDALNTDRKILNKMPALDSIKNFIVALFKKGTKDSTGAFQSGELEKVEKKEHKPIILDKKAVRDVRDSIGELKDIFEQNKVKRAVKDKNITEEQKPERIKRAIRRNKIQG